MNKILPSVSLAIFLCSGAAMAGSAKAPYVGVGLGMNTALKDNSLNPNCGVAGVACREVCDTDRAVNMYAGYPLAPHFAVEAGYTEMDYVARLQQSGGSANGQRGDQQVQALSLSAVGRKALTSGLNVYGKLGAAAWQADATTSVGNADASGLSPVIGAGVEYNFSEHWGLHLGWDRFFSVGKDKYLINGNKASTVKEDLDTAMVGIHYNF